MSRIGPQRLPEMIAAPQGQWILAPPRRLARLMFTYPGNGNTPLYL